MSVLVPLSLSSGHDGYRDAALKALDGISDDVALHTGIQTHGMSAAFGWLVSTAGEDRWPQFANYTGAWRANVLKTDAFVSEARRVTDAIELAGIDVAVTKGVISQSRLYNGVGKRTFSDIDLMIRPDSAGSVANLLDRLGHRAGTGYDASKGCVAPLAREVILKYRMYPDHLLPHTRAGDSNVTHYEIDTAYSLTWFNAPWQVLNEEHLDQRTVHEVTLSTNDVFELPALTPEFDLLFTLLHSFREGWQLTVDLVSGLRLNQFADAALSWAVLDPVARARFVDIVHANSLEYPIAWIASRVDEFANSSLVATCELETHCAREWVNCYKGKGEDYYAWAGSALEQLQARGRVDLVPTPKPSML